MDTAYIAVYMYLNLLWTDKQRYMNLRVTWNIWSQDKKIIVNFFTQEIQMKVIYNSDYKMLLNQGLNQHWQ